MGNLPVFHIAVSSSLAYFCIAKVHFVVSLASAGQMIDIEQDHKLCKQHMLHKVVDSLLETLEDMAFDPFVNSWMLFCLDLRDLETLLGETAVMTSSFLVYQHHKTPLIEHAQEIVRTFREHFEHCETNDCLLLILYLVNKMNHV